MITKEQVKEDLKNSTERLLEVLYAIPEEAFNKRPGQGAWSIGQVAEHLIKVETGTVRLFSGPAEAAARDPQEKIRKIKESMLDFDTAMNASGPIIPDEKPKDKVRVLEKIQDIHLKLASLIEISDLTEVLTGFDHPIFGTLSRVEWIYFNICHSKRHIRQIKNIHNSISS